MRVRDYLDEIDRLEAKIKRLEECGYHHFDDILGAQIEIKDLETKKILTQGIASLRGNPDINITFCDSKINMIGNNACGYPIETEGAVSARDWKTYDSISEVIICPNCESTVLYYASPKKKSHEHVEPGGE